MTSKVFINNVGLNQKIKLQIIKLNKINKKGVIKKTSDGQAMQSSIFKNII